MVPTITTITTPLPSLSKTLCIFFKLAYRVNKRSVFSFGLIKIYSSRFIGPLLHYIMFVIRCLDVYSTMESCIVLPLRTELEDVKVWPREDLNCKRTVESHFRHVRVGNSEGPTFERNLNKVRQKLRLYEVNVKVSPVQLITTTSLNYFLP